MFSSNSHIVCASIQPYLSIYILAIISSRDALYSNLYHTYLAYSTASNTNSTTISSNQSTTITTTIIVINHPIHPFATIFEYISYNSHNISTTLSSLFPYPSPSITSVFSIFHCAYALYPVVHCCLTALYTYPFNNCIILD